MMQRIRSLPFLFFKYALLLSLSGCFLSSYAQEAKIHWGLTVAPAAKIPIVAAGKAYSFWGNVSLCLTTIVEGAEENDLAFSLKTGVAYDVTRYKVPIYGGFLIDRANFFLNPEILFRTGSPRVKIAGGFGVEFNGYYLSQLERSEGSVVDTEAKQKIDDARRKGLAFLTAGLQYDLKHDIFIHLFLKQMLMDAYRGDATISFSGGSDQTKLKLNQIPTYLGIGFAYFF